MTGVVSEDREARVTLTLVCADGTEVRYAATVDSGFNGSVALPELTLRRAGLRTDERIDGVLADGSIVSLEAFLVRLKRFDDERNAVALAVEGGALVGMELLDGHLLTVEVTPGGAVTIAPLP
jgi:predicted aspartyl protease